MASEITLLTVYDKVAGIDSKIDAHVAAVNERLRSGAEQLDDHEKRIRSLERLAWKLVGAFAVVNILAVGAEWFLQAHK